MGGEFRRPHLCPKRKQHPSHLGTYIFWHNFEKAVNFTAFFLHVVKKSIRIWLLQLRMLFFSRHILHLRRRSAILKLKNVKKPGRLKRQQNRPLVFQDMQLLFLKEQNIMIWSNQMIHGEGFKTSKHMMSSVSTEKENGR